MTKIDLEIHDDAIKVINKIKNINDHGIEINIPEGSVLFDNIINLKLISQYAETLGTNIQFMTDDEIGNELISSLDGRSESSSFEMETPENPIPQETSNIQSADAPKFVMPKINFKLPKLHLSGNKSIYFIVAFLLIFLVGYLIYGSKTPKASAKITLASNPLTRSITIKIKAGESTSQDKNLLRGVGVETTVMKNGEADTTGEKLVGDKAEGIAIIYNKSSDDVTLKKNSELVYEENDKEYKFYTTEEISIPASSQEGSEPGSPIIPGKKEVDVVAGDIGSSYNIDDGETLSVTKYKKSVLEAEAKDDFEGGKADKVKVVSEDDRKNLSKKLLDESLTGAEIALKSKLVSPNKLVSGAVSAMVTKESFSHAVGAETTKLTLEQTVTITGLTYSEKELNEMLNKLIDKIAPQGYTVSKNDWSVKVEALGNSTNSLLSATEADVQVTLKTSVVPIVDKDKIISDIAGKKASEAEKVLGSIQNVKSYELKVSPVIPFFNKVPKDLSRIEVIIENE